MKPAIFICLTLLFLSNPVMAKNSGKQGEFAAHLASIIDDVTVGMGEYARPDPHVEKDAEEMINRAKFLIYKDIDKYKGLRDFNKPLKELGIDNTYLIPEATVNQAICRYFGFDPEKYTSFKNIAYRLQAIPGFYAAGAADGGQESYDVTSVKQLKNGLVMAEGITSEAEAPFKAFFKKSDCGGREHWVLLKVAYTRIYEEEDDYRMPQD